MAATVFTQQTLIVILWMSVSTFKIHSQTVPPAYSPIIEKDTAISGSKHYDVGDYIYTYEKPKLLDMFKYIPDDLYKFGHFVVQKENLVWDAAIVGSTAVLIKYDQPIQEQAGKLGNKLGGGWDTDSRYRKFIGLKIVPQNISSGVYYIGNGGTTLLLSGMFLGIGKLNNNDYRALNTSSELVECLISVGAGTQTIKRITGRQSPVRAIPDGNKGGAWHPFPSFADYQNDTPNYDAMPSGHLATYMATITIIAINYPEIKWIKPVGYSLMAILAFNMVSTEVHWVSDYPLGIFMGYVIGKTIAERRITKNPKELLDESSSSKAKVSYRMSRFDNTNLFGCTITF